MLESKKGQVIAAELIARACRDRAFRQQFLADPKAVLIAAGVEVPAGLEIRALEDTPALRHIVLPALVGDPDDLTEAQLAALAGGAGSTGSTAQFEVVTLQATSAAAQAQTMATQTVFGVEAVTAVV